MNKRLLLAVIAVMSLFVFAACGGNSNDGNTGNDKTNNDAANNDAANNDTKNDDKTYKIGVSQFVEHPSLDKAYEGFKAAIEEAGLNVEYDFQNAQGKMDQVGDVSQKLAASSADLIFANATPSAIGILNATDEIPILFTSVTDPIEAGLVEAFDKPGDNITGVVDLHPDSIAESIKFIDEYFKDAKVGLIYNGGEKNSVVQIDAVKEAAEGTSLSIEEATVVESSEVQQVAMTLASKVDVFFIITDNTVVSALDVVIDAANEYDVPLVVGEPDSVGKGGFASYGIDYYTIGHRVGEMAVEILQDGKSTSDIDVEYPGEIELYINKKAAEEQGVEWNDAWDDAILVE